MAKHLPGRQCVHCEREITNAEHTRNGYACDWCTRTIALARFDYMRGYNVNPNLVTYRVPLDLTASIH